MGDWNPIKDIADAGKKYTGLGMLIGGIGDATNGLYNNFTPTMPKINEQTFSPMHEESQVTQNLGAAGYANALQQQQAQIGQQQAFAEALRTQASGAGPNPGEALMQQGLNQAAQQQMGAIANQKGLSPALATRLASMQAAGVAQGAAGAGAQRRAEQQLGAQNQYLGAQNQIGSQLGQMANQGLGQSQLGLSKEQLAQHGMATQNEQLLRAQISQNQIAAAIAGQNTGPNRQILGGLINAGGAAAMGAGMSHGGHVPGEAKVFGDSESNDTVPAMLSPGEIVIPRTAAKDPNKAKEFIDHLKGKMSKESDSKEEPSYGKLLQAHKQISKRLDGIEKKLRSS